MTAYYSEFDPKAAAWLRELIKQGHIADGIVDERDLWDVSPDDLRGFTQVHLCAGIGVWSYALRRAGWPDDRPVWTASFPCQPFSQAGKGKGFADERHLWPAGLHLIRELGPAIVFGEQVSSKDGLAWFDLVQADLEGAGYASGALDTCAAGVGAPHIRQRLYWCAERLAAANSDGARSATRGRDCTEGAVIGVDGRSPRPCADVGLSSAFDVLADPGNARLQERSITDDGRRAVRLEGQTTAQDELSGGLADADGWHASAEREQRGGQQRQQQTDGGARALADAAGARHAEAGQHERRQSQLPARPAEHGGVVRSAGPTNGLWRDADWLFCRDGKWRPVEPGTFPLAHGAPARVGRLRGYGNSLVAPAAQAFIEAYLDSEMDRRIRLEGVFA